MNMLMCSKSKDITIQGWEESKMKKINIILILLALTSMAWGQVYTATSLVIDTITFAELVRRVETNKKQKTEYTYNI